ncbi:monovalent cation/H+ antiporter subunit D [Caldichromatium japonicum]|uniref:Monovalent cation/H+ antiporter subunit D n=1 Tax=Caldichromatium japonicum TaxID=2699430 RepID=A0A6G7VE39_9GAMM|nr:monovalent cation/H+ antiporter subunit D [Caldichromatium japonicum]QIK38309.1 monovalent cation/H+ antiporter subunit D [Caldichromatium japonicum]
MSHLVIAPLLVPLLAGIALLLLGLTLSSPARRTLSLAAVWVQLLLAIELWHLTSGGVVLVYHLGNWPPPWGIVLVADRLTSWMLVLTALLALFALLDAFRGTDRAGCHFHPLFHWQLFGVNGAFLTGDLFNLFVFFEVLLSASYALLIHGGGTERVRAGLQFVVINLVGSTLFLFAAGTFYGLLGTLNLADLALKIAQIPADDQGPVRAAAFLLFTVFALKAALAPLHLWLPPAYAATSAPVAAFFAIMTKVGAYALLRIETLFFGDNAGPLSGLYDDWLLILGLISLVLGALGALAATALRQQIAHLTVASVGLVFVAFGVETRASIAAGLYYLTHSTLVTAAFFLLADPIARNRDSLADRLAPGPALAQAGLLGGLFVVIAILVVGLPPLSGFIGKLGILSAALDTGDWPWIFGVILFSSLIALLALARSGTLLFLHRRPAVMEGRDHPKPIPGYLPWPTLGLLMLALALTIGAGWMLDAAQALAGQLCDAGDYLHAVLQVDRP